MKKTAFIFGLVLLINQSVKSQDYVPFPSEDVYWNVFYAGTCEEAPPDTALLRYTIHGDTSIHDIPYSKICIENGDTAKPTIRGIGGLREADRKIYYTGQTMLGAETEEVYLLYDFTAQPGDTIKHDPTGMFYSLVLDIDSVQIGDTYRKRYQVDNHGFNHNPDYIIEGIGSVKNGLLGHITDIPTCGTHYWEHICFREKGIVKYLNPTFSDCFPSNILADVGILNDQSDFDIYPNPFFNEIYIDTKGNYKDLIFKLMDVTGRTLIENELDASRMILDLNVKSGLYNALIIDRDGAVLLSEKMIK